MRWCCFPAILICTASAFVIYLFFFSSYHLSRGHRASLTLSSAVHLIGYPSLLTGSVINSGITDLPLYGSLGASSGLRSPSPRQWPEGGLSFRKGQLCPRKSELQILLLLQHGLLPTLQVRRKVKMMRGNTSGKKRLRGKKNTLPFPRSILLVSAHHSCWSHIKEPVYFSGHLFSCFVGC